MKIILLALSLFASSAFAIGLGNDNPPSGGGTQINTQVSNVDVSNRISNDVRSSAINYATGGSGSAVANPVSGATANSGGAVSTSGLSITTPKNTPDVFGGNVYPTAPCMGSSQIGGSGVGFGFGIGTSWKDDDCGIRETARSFNSLGLKEDAIKVLCTSSYAAAAPSCKE